MIEIYVGVGIRLCPSVSPASFARIPTWMASTHRSIISCNCDPILVIQTGFWDYALRSHDQMSYNWWSETLLSVGRDQKQKKSRVGPFLLPVTWYQKDAHLAGPYTPICKQDMILCRSPIEGVSVDILIKDMAVVVEMFSGQWMIHSFLVIRWST